MGMLHQQKGQSQCSAFEADVKKDRGMKDAEYSDGPHHGVGEEVGAVGREAEACDRVSVALERHGHFHLAQVPYLSNG